MSVASIRVEVELGDRSYPIEVGSGVLAQLGERLRGVLKPGLVHIVTNPTVGALYYNPVAAVLREAGFTPSRVEIPDGEEHKNLGTLASIYDQVLEGGAERSSPIIALGGGVVGDVAGFAAATVLRGVPYVQVPTTLLAQVDSSVGGKTAINHRVGKNLIGAFYQPRMVVIDIDTLRTLPRRELLAGLAEVIKYGVILDRQLFEQIERELDDLLALRPDLVRDVVARCCAIKAEVVAADEREADFRAVLNFGHTVGHAVEAATGYRALLHGEAVAIGMVAAAKVSRHLGHCAAEDGERIARLLDRAGLPTELPQGLSAPELRAAIAHDKKAEAGEVKFVCLEAIGRTGFVRLPPDQILAALADSPSVDG